MAAHRVALAARCLRQLAARAAKAQRGRKLQPGSGAQRSGRLPWMGARRPACARSGRGKRGQQALGVGMARAIQHRAGRAGLDDAAGIEHRYRIAEAIDDAEIVADQQHGEVAPRPAARRAGTGSAPRWSRRAPSWARRATAGRARWPARWRCRLSASCRRRAGADSSSSPGPGGEFPSRPEAPSRDAQAARRSVPRWMRIGSVTWLPIVSAGLSAAAVSWNTTPTRRPRKAGASRSRSWPSKARRCAWTRAAGPSRPSSASTTVDLPDPDSPTSPSTPPGGMDERHAIERLQPARARRIGHRQCLDLQHGIAAVSDQIGQGGVRHARVR